MNIPLLGKPSPIKKYKQLIPLLRKYCAYRSYLPALRSVQFNGDGITVYDLETHVTLNLQTDINGVAIEFNDLKKLGSTLISDYESEVVSSYKLFVTEKKDFDYLEVEESFEFKTKEEAKSHLDTLEAKSHRIVQTDYLHLENESSKIVLSTIDQNELPETPDVGELHSEVIWSLETLQQIGLVVSAAATDESRPVFKGISVSGKNGILTSVCADGFMLLKNEIVSEIDFDIIVPALLFKKALEGFKQFKDYEIKVEIFNEWIRLSGETMVWTQRLIEGEFPDWKRIVPKKIDNVDLTWGENCLQVVKDILQSYPYSTKVGGPGIIFSVFSDGKVEVPDSEAVGQFEYKIDLKMGNGCFRLNPVMVKKVLEAFGETKGWYIYKESGVNPIVFERGGLLGIIMPMHTGR